MSDIKDNDKKNILEALFGDSWSGNDKKDSKDEKPVVLEQKSKPRPSLETIGLTDCSVCKAEVSVVLTKTGHPFTACGKCGARTFFNSRVAIDILQRQTRSI